MSNDQDANLSPDMRALVVVLREIRDEGRRCADALERIAETSESFVDESFRTEIVAE